MTETTSITTQVHVDSDGFDIRREFCGFQDVRLNDLRQFTSCIIDLQTHGVKDPFEQVTWVISHYDSSVRAFVAKRLQSWAQATQIAAQIHRDDANFRQQTLSDSSSSSTDLKVHQLGRPMNFSPSPSMSSVPMMLNKHSKTPSHDHHYGSVPSAALVPQTDLQPRNQQRRRRNSSSSSSGIRRPALFGKPSDFFFSRDADYVHHRDTVLSSKYLAKEPVKLLDEVGFTFIKPKNSFGVNVHPSKENQDYNDADLEEEAKWANLLSDNSDFEDVSLPLMADVILVAQFRDCLIECGATATDSVNSIQSKLTSPFVLTGNVQIKTLKSRPIWFYRLILNSKIILANGVHKCREQAQSIAYKKMIELITHHQGVQLKIIANGRCKVTLRKAAPTKCFNETTLLDATMNSMPNDSLIRAQ